MICEIEITLRTLLRVVFGSLANKIHICFRQLFCGVLFFFLRLPRNATPTELADFSFTAADGLLQTAQVRSEIIQLADLIGKRQPRTVVERITAQGGTLVPWCRQANPADMMASLGSAGRASRRRLSVLEIVDLPAAPRRDAEAAPVMR